MLGGGFTWFILSENVQMADYKTTHVLIYVHVRHIWECKIVKSKCNGLIFLVTVQTILVSLCHVIQMSRPGIDCNDNKCIKIWLRIFHTDAQISSLLCSQAHRLFPFKFFRQERWGGDQIFVSRGLLRRAGSTKNRFSHCQRDCEYKISGMSYARQRVSIYNGDG